MYREISLSEVKLDKTLGYQYFIDKKHPLASKEVHRVYYHRHLASIYILNRWVAANEAVHHIDNNKSNNSIDNLQVMSNSEHAKIHHAAMEQVSLICPICTKKFSVSINQSIIRKSCSTVCAVKLATKWDITKEDLQILIWNMPYVDIAKIFSISDKGAKKRAIALGCLLPPPYFFNKTNSFRQEQRKLNSIPDLPT